MGTYIISLTYLLTYVTYKLCHLACSTYHEHIHHYHHQAMHTVCLSLTLIRHFYLALSRDGWQGTHTHILLKSLGFLAACFFVCYLLH